MDDVVPPKHVLAFLEESPGDAAVLRSSHAIAELLGSRLTVLAVAAIPKEPAGCCDLKTSLWKRLQVEVALEQLKHARQQLAAHGGVTFALGEGPKVADVVAREAEDRGCDLIIVPDERRRRRRTLADRVRQRTQSRVATPTELSRQSPASMPTAASDGFR